MTSLHTRWFAALPALLLVAACATAPATPAGREDLKASALDALRQLKAEDPTLGSPFLESAYGYAVFPSVGKGAYLVGGSYGRGIVYRRGLPVGFADITQATVGFQFGGQSYMELVAFESPEAFQRFTSGRLTGTANLSAVILKTGAGAAARYADGVAVFVRPVGGAMIEAAVGGQQFTYQSM
jgi:lipid-binding SYLF domain-containing protein